MMLAATSLNIGSCWVNQLKWLTDNPPILQFMKKLGLTDSEIICSGLTLGYPDQKNYNRLNGQETSLPL